MLDHVAVLYHPRRKQAVLEAEWLAGELNARGVKIGIGNAWDPDVVEHCAREVGLLVALGGDGTILHVAKASASCGTPLVGVNLGRVGFLAELTPQSLRCKVDALVEERYWIEQRTMLAVELHERDQIERFLCLNEVAVGRGTSPRAVLVDMLLDGEDFMTYSADAVLVATATGSTAYSLAAGGPILYPESTDFLLTPVAPHLHIGRSMVVPGDTTVTLRPHSDRPAIVSVDGMVDRPLSPADAVYVRRSGVTARFVRLGPRRYFYQAIADRLK